MEARRPTRRPRVYTLCNYLLTYPCPLLECGPLEISPTGSKHLEE